jgi:hypothetical protein
VLNIGFIKSRSFRKAFMLVGVYALHLVFFQVLMQASPSHNLDKSFKPLLVRHQSNSNKTQPSNHPAVSYYTMLIKQGKDGGRICSIEAPVIHRTDAVLPQSPAALAVTFHIYQTGLTRLNIADDAFKRYSLLRVFLI